VTEPRFSLTPAGLCVGCGAQLYLELLLSPDDEACGQCCPPDDGQRPPFVLLQGGLFETPAEEVERFFDVRAKLAEASQLDKRILHGHCTEACCSPVAVRAQALSRKWASMHAPMVTCIGCGTYLSRSAAEWRDGGFRCAGDCIPF
jgi:hypothetical protein